MPCKLLTAFPFGRILRLISTLAWAALLQLTASPPAFADEPGGVAPKFLGAQGCAASSCHGGAGNNQNQFTVWSKADFHHERPVALLETRRSTVIAEALKIDDPVRSGRCTVCHAPLQTVSPDQLGHDARIIEGVSCECCHAPAENWLRSHTRKDWTTADRVSAGMRDLRNLYVRANTCVACHQNVDADLRQAGHPQLIFELDGQAVSEPKHWRKSEDKPGPQIWLVGQAVALREITWQLSRENSADKTLRDQLEGLLWIMQPVCAKESQLPRFDPGFYSAEGGDLPRIHQWGDDLAKAAADLVWSEDQTRGCLAALADTGGSFADKTVSTQIHARRAERLVLALDRLAGGVGKLSASPQLNATLDRLFADVQSLPDFDPSQFAEHLNEFHTNLADVSK